MIESKRNLYDFKICIKCGKEKEETGHTLSYLELREIGCNKGKPFACLPICDDCYYELFKKRLRKKKKSEAQ